MKLNRYFILALSALALTVLLLVSLAGCKFGASFSSASLSEATMCRSVNPQTKQPLDKTNTFSPDTAVIYCTVKISNAPPGTEVKTQWTYVKGELQGVTNHLIAEASMKTEGTRYLSFAYEAPANGLPNGDYTVSSQVSGKNKLTVPFSVKGSASSLPAQTAKVTLANTFQKAGFGYTIKYPSDWEYETPTTYKVVIGGKQGTAAFDAFVAIQTVASTKAGGTIANVDSLLDSYKNSIKSADASAKFYGEKAFVYAIQGGAKLNGKEITMEYASQGQNFKTWRIAIPMSNGNGFYTWLYQAPLAIYDTYLPLAQGMLESWNITQ